MITIVQMRVIFPKKTKLTLKILQEKKILQNCSHKLNKLLTVIMKMIRLIITIIVII